MPSPRDATVARTGGSHSESSRRGTALPRPPSPSPARGGGGGGEWWGATCRNAFPRRIPSSTSTSWPRVAMERMKTCGSRLADSIRMRSPSSAPPVNGLVGSTATTPTESPCPRYCWMSRSVSVLLPAPGGPVMPIRRAAPRASRGCAWLSTRSKPSRWFSTRVIARASAAGSCRSSASRMRSTLMQSNQTRGAPSRPLLRAIERHGPHRARPHRDALHPRGGGREDIEFQSLQREPLPRPGDASQRQEQEAPHRLRAPRLERDAEALLEPARRGVALDLDDAGGGLAGGGRRRARLEDLRHQVPQQILERHEPCRAAEF